MSGTIHYPAAIGMMPALQYAPPEMLQIDEGYQRALDGGASASLIRRIAIGWNWDLCQPLVVAKRANGGLFVIDGQHRLAAAKMRGDIQQLPCVVVDYGSPAQEARAFVALNQMRRPLTAMDIFKAAVASGDPESLQIVAALGNAGLQLAKHSNPTAWQPGMVAHIGGISRCWRERGPAVAAEALAVLAAAYPDVVLQYAGTLWPGIAAVVHRGLDYDRQRFADILRARTQLEWRHAMARYIADNPKEGRSGAMAAVMMQAWRGELADEPPTPAEVPDTHWCKQCDATVPTRIARACKSKFCSLRGAL